MITNDGALIEMPIIEVSVEGRDWVFHWVDMIRAETAAAATLMI